jgi:hypothetical protein
MNILPRQARDKHRKNSKKKAVFSQCMRVLYSIQDAVSKNRLSFFIPNSHPKNDHFTETILPRQARDKHEGKHSKRGDHLLRSRISSGRRPSRAKRRQPGAKNAFFCAIDIEMIISPRQARDKHRESSTQERVAFFAGAAVPSSQLTSRS